MFAIFWTVWKWSTCWKLKLPIIVYHGISLTHLFAPICHYCIVVTRNFRVSLSLSPSLSLSLGVFLCIRMSVVTVCHRRLYLLFVIECHMYTIRFSSRLDWVSTATRYLSKKISTLHTTFSNGIIFGFPWWGNHLSMNSFHIS